MSLPVRGLNPVPHLFGFIADDAQEFEKEIPVFHDNGFPLSDRFVGKDRLGPVEYNKINFFPQKSFQIEGNPAFSRISLFDTLPLQALFGPEIDGDVKSPSLRIFPRAEDPKKKAKATSSL